MKSKWIWNDGGELLFRRKIDAGDLCKICIIEDAIEVDLTASKLTWRYPCYEWPECVKQDIVLAPCKICGHPHKIEGMFIRCSNRMGCPVAAVLLKKEEWIKLMSGAS